MVPDHDSCHGAAFEVRVQERDAPLRFPDDSSRTLAEFIQACPAGSVIELAPGRYAGPLRVDKPLVVRGAGDLTRIFDNGTGRVAEVRLESGEQAGLESVLLEGGAAETGAGLSLQAGRLRLHNVHIQHCRASRGGGAVHVAGGDLDASVLRIHDVSGARGGALWVEGEGTVRLRDSQIGRCEAEKGGAMAVEGPASVTLEAVTVQRSRATTAAGGQALYVRGTDAGRPHLSLRRVRLEDVPLGLPLVVDPSLPGDVTLLGCDVPRVLQGQPGVVDGGENRWR